MKYTAPEIEILELDLVDVIQTSAVEEGGEEGGDLKENELPMN